MAARRFVKSSIDWAAFAERIPAHEKQKFQQFKAKVDNYTKKYISYIQGFLICCSLDSKCTRKNL